MKETWYFPHDYNARNDEKTVALILETGLEGYGIYWFLIEKLYEAGGRIAANYGMLAKELRVREVSIKRVLEDFGLFRVSDGRIGSPSVDRRIRKRKQISARRSMAGSVGGMVRWKANARQMPGKIKNRQMPGKCLALNEMKLNEKKGVDGTQPSIPPPIEDVKAYCLERRNAVDPQKWWDFYASKGWMVGSNKMRDWRAAVRTWEREDGARAAAQPSQEPPRPRCRCGRTGSFPEVISVRTGTMVCWLCSQEEESVMGSGGQ